MQRLTDAARQMNVGGRHDDMVLPIVDGHYPVKRMLGILELLLIAGKVNDLFFVQSKEFSGQMDLARWILIVYPVAGLAELLAGTDRRRPPAPAIALVYGAALRADGRVYELQSSSIGIVNVLMNETVAALRLPWIISLTHTSSFIVIGTG
jgi:hypothetical protein